MNFEKITLLFVTIFLFCFSYAQNNNWIMGTWEGGGSSANKAQFTRTIVIDSIGGQNFAGTRTNESKDKSHAKIITALTGYIENKMLVIQNGSIIYKKEPGNGRWLDCSGCLPQTKISIQGEKILLTSDISGCQSECNGTTIYYKYLCDFDTSTQRDLINRFGDALNIAGFDPCIKKTPEMIAEEEKRRQHIQDSINNAESIAKQKAQQRNKDSVDAAAAIAKQKQKQTDDSIAIIKKRAQQITDSLNVVTANEKKRQQFVQDSITTANNIAKQKELQRIKDSVDAATAIAKQKQKQIDDSITVAKNRQQQVNDSLNVIAVAEKKRQQFVQDSITAANNIAKQKELQRIKDSVDAATAMVKQKQKQIEDSITVAKNRQQQINDSLNVIAAAEKKRQQFVQDSTTTAKNIAKQKDLQRIKDSLINATALAKQGQKAIEDSITIAKQRRQQITDSLNVVATNQKKRQQYIQDSITTANNIAKQKEIQRVKDSVSNAQAFARKRQKEIDDSVKVAKKRELQITDSLNMVAANEKKRLQHIQDSITTANNITKLKEQQHISDSIARTAVVKKTPITPKDTAKASTSNAFATRGNVLLQTYHITTPDILIELFDNAQVDGDRVSVYHNNQIIISNKMLTKEPITIHIKADAADRMHEFTMIAENLGTIPPNTALMRITAGSQVYKLSVKTDLQTNAKIVFYYDGN